MNLFQKELAFALFTPHGETIYELVGRLPEHGGTAALSLAHIVIPPGKASLAHTHKVIEETYYILRGDARVFLDNRQFNLAPSQAVLILPGQLHQIFNSGEADLEFLAICSPAWYPEDAFIDNHLRDTENTE